MKEREIMIEIERCMDNVKQEAERPDDKAGDLHSLKVCSMAVNVDVSINGESSVEAGGVSPDSGEKTRRMSMSGKKPPRPPRGLSLDAADQKLIKEISDLLVIKRARMKALKRTKAAKGMSATASTSTSSAAYFVAMFFTILFCIVIIFQGCHSWGRSSSAVEEKRNSSTNTIAVVPRWNENAASSVVL